MALKYSTDLAWLSSLRDALALRVRRRVFELFMTECRPSPESRVADFGVSGNREHPTHYFFEMLYPRREHLTVLGRVSENARWYPERFPGITFVECDLREIPLPDDYFDAGICNAVVEHAGPREQQVALVAEVCRVSRSVMFTTPNRWFPVELHTFLPVLHWFPDQVYRRILSAIGHGYFAEVDNLNLLDGGSLLALFPRHRENRLLRIGIPLMPTNLVCISRKVNS